MQLSNKEEQLFKEWRGNRAGFVYDGIVSEKDYVNSEIDKFYSLVMPKDSNNG